MDVVVAMTAAKVAVVVTNFLTSSQASVEALRAATLLKGLTVNALIFGPVGTGKETLAKFIVPHAPIFNSSEYDVILNALPTINEIIVLDIDTIANLTIMYEQCKKNSVRLIATSRISLMHEKSDLIFPLKIELPPLAERIEDVDILVDYFIQFAQDEFALNHDIVLEDFTPDISENAISLKKQIYQNVLLKELSDTALMEMLQTFLVQRIGTKNDYREFLYLYEIPLLKAGFERFKSQLKLSQELGINRNTLRKKLEEYPELQNKENE